MSRLQEIFDTVARHLIKQGEAAVVANECMYRTPDGLKCAAGCLIPDYEYSPKFEGKGAIHLPWFQQNFPSNTEMALIRQLQSVHDNGLRDLGIEGWKKQMAIIANEFNLSSEILGMES